MTMQYIRYTQDALLSPDAPYAVGSAFTVPTIADMRLLTNIVLTQPPDNASIVNIPQIAIGALINNTLFTVASASLYPFAQGVDLNGDILRQSGTVQLCVVSDIVCSIESVLMVVETDPLTLDWVYLKDEYGKKRWGKI